MPDVPYNKVIMFRRQGLTNAQIIQALQREGYNSTQIFDALNQADVKAADFDQSPMEGEKMEEQQTYPNYPSYPQTMGLNSLSEDKIAEISEAIIEEKWSELVEHVNKIIEWKNAVEARIISIEEQFKALKDNFDKLHEAVIGKLGEYDRGIKETGTSIKALEEVFKRILPGFVENVQELSRITAKMKGSDSKK